MCSSGVGSLQARFSQGERALQYDVPLSLLDDLEELSLVDELESDETASSATAAPTIDDPPDENGSAMTGAALPSEALPSEAPHDAPAPPPPDRPPLPTSNRSSSRAPELVLVDP